MLSAVLCLYTISADPAMTTLRGQVMIRMPESKSEDK